MPIADAIYRPNTHSKATPCFITSAIAPQKRVSPSPQAQLFTHSLTAPATPALSINSSSLLHRKHPTVKCYYYKNSVEIETARELAQQEISWFDSIRELLNYTGDDPGHWNYSPEWWGSQGDSFGRNEGQVVFSKQSQYNGLVQVTSHPASLNGFTSDNSRAFGDETRQEWRVLRFNNVTRQSVARVTITTSTTTSTSSNSGGDRRAMQQRRWLEKGQSIIAQPDCVASEYLKTMTAVFGAVLGLQGLFQSAGKSTSTYATTSPPASSRRPISVLCIGLGGGTLPHFIAHHFPQAHVDAVEIDPIVVEAATIAMGLQVSEFSNLRVHTEDAFEFLKNRKKILNGSNGNTNNADLYDVVCIDAFDGENNVPSQLRSPEFGAMLGTVLNPKHGTVLMNLHNTSDVECIGNTFYESFVLGNVDDNNDRNTSISSSSRGPTPTGAGCCFSVETQMQANYALVCARGLKLPLNEEEAKQMLRYAGVYVGHESGYRFPAGVRAERNYLRLK